MTDKISFDIWEKLDIKVAKIKSVEDHPNADKLIVLKVDIGKEERQIVAGIKKHYNKEELVGKSIVVLTNLEPAKLRGIESQGMLLAAVDGEEVILLQPEKDISPGSKVR